MRLPAAVRASTRTPFLQVVKTSVATIAAWILGFALFQQHAPIFAAIAALLCVQPSVNQSVGKAIERSVGVIAGVLIAYLAGLAFGQAGWLVVLAIVASMLLAWALRLTPGSGNQIAISAMLVLSIGDTTDYALERIAETILGGAIGVIVNVLIVPPVLVAPAEQAIRRLTSDTSAALNRLAEALTQVRDRAWLEAAMRQVRELRTARDDASDAIGKARESLGLNPRGTRHRAQLNALDIALDRLGPIVTQLIGMTRTVLDNYDRELSNEPTVVAMADEMERAAHDLLLLSPGRTTGWSDGAKPATAELPALTAPLRIGRPSPDHWILIGSLMEDLRRIRDGIVDEQAYH
ncbi:MAG: FUSC family protein [Microbacteriaceae bacterium]